MPALIRTNSQGISSIVIPVGVTEPPFMDSIRRGEQTVNTEGAEIKFYLRPLLSRTPVINGEAGEPIWPANKEGYNVQYKWTSENVATEGEYMAWWWYSKEGVIEETPEFPITISDHGPGTGVKTGGIYDGVFDHMPVTATALSKDPAFGERRIQKYATLIQLKVMGTYVEPDAEIGTYALPLLDYFSKRVALELCTPGIEYWGRQHKTITAQGPTEISSFPDMIGTLEKLRTRLVKELEEDWEYLKFLIPTSTLVQRKPVHMPSSSLEYHEHTEQNGNLIRRERPVQAITRDPNQTQPLQSGYWGFFDEMALGFFPFP